MHTARVLDLTERAMGVSCENREELLTIVDSKLWKLQHAAGQFWTCVRSCVVTFLSPSRPQNKNEYRWERSMEFSVLVLPCYSTVQCCVGLVVEHSCPRGKSL